MWDSFTELITWGIESPEYENNIGKSRQVQMGLFLFSFVT